MSKNSPCILKFKNYPLKWPFGKTAEWELYLLELSASIKFKECLSSVLICCNEGCSVNNSSCFIMLAHDIQGRCWWYCTRGWTFQQCSITTPRFQISSICHIALYVVRNAIKKKKYFSDLIALEKVNSSQRNVSPCITHRHTSEFWCHLLQFSRTHIVFFFFSRLKPFLSTEYSFYTYAKSVFPVRLFPGDLWFHSVCQTPFC